MAEAEQKPSVATPHPSYLRMLVKWQRCRDVAEGEDAVHAAGGLYLPQLVEQEQVDYDAYVARTPLYNATWRTIAGLNGMLFRKPPKVEVSDDVRELLKDVTLSGVPLTVFAQNIGQQCLEVGRIGVLVDYPATDLNGKTKADAAKLNLRPTMAAYRAEAIVNWRTATIRNRHVLTQVRLKELHCEPDGEFGELVETRYRVLDLDENGEYRQRVFQVETDAAGNTTDVLVAGPFWPLMRNARLDFIPFAFIGPDDTTPEVDDPPLIDLVNLNLSHYRTRADYELGCHFTGCPQPWVTGHRMARDETNRITERLTIGSTNAWVFEEPEAKVGFLALNGQNLQELRQNLQDKKDEMAILGARMLEAQKRQVEAVGTAEIHRKGEESVLSSIAGAMSLGLTRALQWFSDWAGASGEVSIEINREFLPRPLDAASLRELFVQLQGGGISYPTYYDNLQRSGLAPDDRTWEDERALIDNQPPTLIDALIPRNTATEGGNGQAEAGAAAAVAA